MPNLSSTQHSSREDPILIDGDDDTDSGPVEANMPASTSADRLNEPSARPSTSTHFAGPSSPRRGSPDTLGNITPAMSVATVSTRSESTTADTIQYSRSNQQASSPRATSASMDRYRTGYVYDPQMMLHVNPIDPEHPERPIRIFKIYQSLNAASCLTRMKRIPIREVTEDEVKLVHDKGIWDGVERSAFYAPDYLKEQVAMLENYSSLYINEHSAYAARLSCGGAIELCDAIAAGRIRNGFAIIRPPGHHAEPHKSMGFCFYNNVAVATRFLQNKYAEGPNQIKKILILDWDVHHGNGTQKAFENDPNVLYISIHRYDEDGSFYPGSTYGNYDSDGVGAGKGSSVNIPWPTKGMGDGDYLYAFRHLVMPIATEFEPDFVIISAGFDAAEHDPIGQNKVTPGGYAQMTHALTALCEGKLAVVLEGGYEPDAVASSALAVTRVILSDPPRPPRDTIASSVAARTVQLVCRHHSQYWNSIIIPEIEEDDQDADPLTGIPGINFGQYVSDYRRHSVCAKYRLMEIPLTKDPYRFFDGHVLCSQGILDTFETIVFFIHDIGNLRYEKSDHKLNQEMVKLVDGSSKILDYVRNQKFGVIDMNVYKQFAARPPPMSQVANAYARRNQSGTQTHVADSTADFLWDNIVSISPDKIKNVVLIGFGSGCDVVSHLIQERSTERVRAVVNVVGYGTMPRIDHTRDLPLKKWYWNKSKIIAPKDHPHLVETAGNNPLKRFGRIQASDEIRPINILAHHLGDITSFIDKKLRIAKGQSASVSMAVDT